MSTAYLALVAAVIALAGCSAGSAEPVILVSRDGIASREDMQRVMYAVQGDPVDFAGIWWDAFAPFPLHAAYANDDPALRAKVEQWLPPGGSIAWHHVRYSYNELEAIQGEVLAWATRTGHVNSSGTDLVRNRVSVSVTEHDLTFEGDIVARYPDGIEFIIGPPNEPL